MCYYHITPYGTKLEYPLWNYTQVGPVEVQTSRPFYRKTIFPPGIKNIDLVEFLPVLKTF